MLRRRQFIIGLAVTGAASALAGQSQAGARSLSWQILGRCRVDGATPASRIELPGGGGIRAIRLRSEALGVRLDRVRLHFRGGVSVDLPEPREVPAHGASRAIALPGGQHLRAVDLTWHVAAGAGQAAAPPTKAEETEVTLLGLLA